MVLLKNCKIVFNSDSGVVFSGTEAQGYVQLTFFVHTKITELTIRLKGEKSSSWSEKSGDDRRSYSGKETYFRVVNNLLAASTLQNVALEFPPGEHKFYFSLMIPPEATTSFEGPFGKVLYTATVTLKGPGAFFDQTYRETFKVLETRDLNLYPHLRDPLEVQQSKVFHTFFVNVGSVHVKANVFQTGFVPGQTAILKCNIHNASSVSNPKVKFFLKQMVIYKTSRVLDGKIRKFEDHTESRNFFSKMKVCGVDKGQQKDFHVEVFIPDDMPPSWDPLVPTVLAIQYFIVVKVCVTGGHIDMEVSVPIQIGTIPLKATEEYLMEKDYSQFGRGNTSFSDNQVPSYSLNKK